MQIDFVEVGDSGSSNTEKATSQKLHPVPF